MKALSWNSNPELVKGSPSILQAHCQSRTPALSLLEEAITPPNFAKDLFSYRPATKI